LCLKPFITVSIVSTTQDREVSQFQLRDGDEPLQLKLEVRFNATDRLSSSTIGTFPVVASTVLFGQLCFRPVEESGKAHSTYPTYSIPVRGVMHEVPVFCLSTNAVDVCAATEGDSDDEAEAEDSKKHSNSLAARLLVDDDDALSSSSQEKFHSMAPRTSVTVTNLSHHFEVTIVVDHYNDGSHVEDADGTSNALVFAPRTQHLGPREECKVYIQLADDAAVEDGQVLRCIVADHFAPQLSQEIECTVVPSRFTATYFERRELHDKNDTALAVEPRFKDLSLASMFHGPPRSTSPVRIPKLILSGCTPIDLPITSSHQLRVGTSHEIKVGNVKVGDAVSWTFSIVHDGNGSDAVRYKIYPATSEDFTWLSIDNTSGELSRSTDSAAQAAKNVHLRIRSAEPGFRLTYLVVENVTNPSDWKFIRVSMHAVVADSVITSLQARAEAPPSVLQLMLPQICELLSPEHVALNLGRIFENTPSRIQSFLLTNTSATSVVEVTLGSNDCVGLVEVNFTSSPFDPPAFCRHVALQPGEQIRVFVDVTVGPELWKQHLASHPSDTTPTSDIPLMTTKGEPLEVVIACKTVPEPPMSFRLVAACCRRSFTVSNPTVSFAISHELLSDQAAIEKGLHPTHNIALEGIDDDPAPEVVVFANLIFFNCRVLVGDSEFHTGFGKDDGALPRGAAGGAAPVVASSRTWHGADTQRMTAWTRILRGRKRRIEISLNVAAILAHSDRLLSRRYIIETVTIYNADNWSEREEITLALHQGHHQVYYASPWRGVLKGKLATLEARVALLIKQLRGDVGDIGTLPSKADLSGPAVGPIVMQLTTEFLFEYVCIADEFVRAGVESRNSHDYLFGNHLANLLFSTILGSPVFMEHAPAALPSWTPVATEDRVWPVKLQPWILPLCKYLTVCSSDLPTLASLMKLADSLLLT
jgi:hypothetical protein